MRPRLSGTAAIARPLTAATRAFSETTSDGEGFRSRRIRGLLDTPRPVGSSRRRARLEAEPSGGQHGRELRARVDPQLAIGAGEVCGHGVDGHEEALTDLA